MSRTIQIDMYGKTYYGIMATIYSTMLGFEDNGILTAMLHCSWTSGGIGVGGYRLDRPVKETHTSEGNAFGLDHVMKIMTTVGVSTWEELVGKHVIVLFPNEGTWGSSAIGIANATNENLLLDFKDHAESWKDREMT